MFSLAALAVLLAAGWLAPAVLVHTGLRDRPLEAAFAGIAGSIASSAARWHWLAGIEYRDVVLRDQAGQPAVLVRSLVIEKGLLGLVLDPTSLGTIRLAGVEAAVAVRRGGSSLEDILTPWLAAPRDRSGITCDLEVVGGTVEFVDTERNDAWRIVELFAAGTLLPEGTFAGWTAGGRLTYAGVAAEPVPAEPPASPSPPTESLRLDRTALPAAAAAVLARDGGWSVSAPAGLETTITVTAHRLPLGGSSIVATRIGAERLFDGLADVRLDLSRGAGRREVRGRFVVERFAVCRADTLAEEFAVERCELPLHATFTDDDIVVHELRFTSPVARGEVSGRLAWPGDDAWRWLDGCVGRDCSLTADVDLAAAAQALPGGLVVRPEVRVTGGSLRLAAVARGDGADRVLEVRLEARDLAAVRTEPPGDAGEPATERPLRWNEPFTGWLRARRGPVGGASLRIEEGRLTSPAMEVSAAGTPAAVQMQWTADLGGLVGELGEVLDMGGTSLAGTCRGRVDIERGSGGLSTAKVAASISGFELEAAGRPLWQDEAITLDAEATGSFTSGSATIESGRAMVTAQADSLEATLTGGALVDVAALLSSSRVTLRPARAGTEVAADCSLVGDLGRWQRRLAAWLPLFATPGLELAGSVQAEAAVAAAGGDAWRITKAGGEIERFTLVLGDRRVSEPRIVATAAGTARPLSGRFDISSAELLTSTLSLRTGGVSWTPPPAADPLGPLRPTSPLDTLLASVRGRVQWQADLTRLESWLVAADVADRWPVSGRGWGTLDVAQTQTGLNLLVEATGSQLSILTRPAGGNPAATPQAVWSEPKVSVAFEVTRPFVRAAAGGLAAADRLVIDRLAVQSSTLAFTSRGAVGDLSGQRQVTLEGNLAYDWEQLSRLATPWTGGRVRASGSGERPFTIRAALGGARASPAGAEGGSAAAAGTLPLPEEWLAAVQANAGEPAVQRPAVQATASSRGFSGRLEDIALDTSAAWAAAEIDGFPLAAGDVAVRLVEGQLAFGPFDVAAAGGRLRGAPWVRLAPWPGELIVPPGRVVERVALSGNLCGRVVAAISPLLAGATKTSGLVSVDLAGARVPLGDPRAGEAAGQVLFEQFEVQPSGAMQPLMNLLVRLQSVIDPRFALGDKAVLLRVRPEPIRVRLAERRIWHEGLVMDSGPLAISSRGSVGEDGSLAAVVEVAFRGEAAGQTPVVAQLLRTPIVIPLKGTLARPQFDAGAIDVVVKRIVENTARAVFDDGIGRGLEAVFGSPPPAPPQASQPAPLTLPQ